MIPKISKKKLAKLGGKVPLSSITASRKAPRKRKRKPSETLRIYGGKKRIEWIKSQPCVGCGYRGPAIQNAHIKTGGMGRKADAEFIVPLCDTHDDEVGCHPLFHHWGKETFESVMLLDLNAEAEKVERAWQDHLNGESAK